MMLLRGRPPTPQPPEPHTFLTSCMMKYTMHNTESGSLSTTFGVFDLHAAAAPPWAFLALPMMGPSSLLTKSTFLSNTLISSLYFFHYRSFHRPLNLTPTARSGCGLHSLVTTIKRGIVRKKTTFLASFSAHDARLPLHSYNQRCKKLWSTRLLR